MNFCPYKSFAFVCQCNVSFGRILLLLRCHLITYSPMLTFIRILRIIVSHLLFTRLWYPMVVSLPFSGDLQGYASRQLGVGPSEFDNSFSTFSIAEPRILQFRARSLLSAVSLLLHGHGLLSFPGVATNKFGTTRSLILTIQNDAIF